MRPRAARDRRWILAVSFALGVGVLTAAATTAPARAERLTIDRAIEIARANSPALLQQRSAAEAARSAHREAKAARLPRLDVMEVATRTDSPGDVFGLRLAQERFSFPSFMQNDPNQPDDMVDWATEIEVGLPLFTGGRIGAGIGQAAHMSRAAEWSATYAATALENAVAGAYMDVLLAERSLDVARMARETTARHVARAQDLFDAGMMVESDLLQAQVQLARMDEGMITAANRARLARSGLLMAMGLDETPDVSFELADSLPETPLPPDADIDAAVAAALDGRGDLRAAEQAVEAASLGVRRAQGEYLPEVAVAARYGLHDDRPFGDHGDRFALMGMLRWNVWNGGATGARVARSKSERAAAHEALRARRQQSALEVRTAWQGIEEARARLDVATGGVASAERAHAILEDRFAEGIARMTDLLDAETMLHEARLRELQARFDLERSIRRLHFATGRSVTTTAAREEIQ